MGQGFLSDLDQTTQQHRNFFLKNYKLPVLEKNPLKPSSYIRTMNSHQPYPMPKGCHLIPPHLTNQRTDTEIDQDFTTFKPVASDKNFWGFYGTGFSSMPPHYQRNDRTWACRLEPLGWTVRILDRVPSSPNHVSNFLDTTDPSIIPKAFIDGNVKGDFKPQHISDLVRFPLLLKYGSMYADVGCMLIGDLDRLWSSTVGDPNSKYETLAFNTGVERRSVTNYFMGFLRNNHFSNACMNFSLKDSGMQMVGESTQWQCIKVLYSKDCR